MVNTRNNCNS
jgi:hypothetical protein